MDWRKKNVLVAGCGISGISAALLLESKGTRVFLYDENEKADTAKIREKLGMDSQAQVLIGALPKEVEDNIELVVLSPGVPLEASFAVGFRKRQIPIIGEIELAWLCGKGRVIAITGTNGKTTTTALCGKIMEDYFDSVFVVGNIGNPYTKAVENMNQDSVTVAEISSFQLETIHTFHPHITAILNITPDHLNRHHTMENYVAMKEQIAKNQNQEDFCVLNYEDAYCQSFAKRCPARVVFFSSERELENGYFLEGEDIWYSHNGQKVRLINIHEMKLPGIHNVENVMAAIAIASAFLVPMENILNTVRNFSAVEHRIEYVTTIQGVDYYNDSKGTNPDAAIRGIRAMSRPTVLIGGGYDKDSEYGGWIDSFEGKVTWLILLGQTREKIAACARKKGFTNLILVDSLEEAVKTASRKARAGEAVLLSPACASWGMFPNYEVRGRLFKEYVMNLKES
ncbi:MAG: UDP-N-acetylmuramoyl-L-alanine--D-glutamate ligase [Lachnospiraceae bacterium]|nr:UDP-N-acetylmuramoyl-L-alanine--D-glutamate ligase [Lachnospiraceae bacterium]